LKEIFPTDTRLSMTEVNPSLYPVINKEDSIEFAVQVLKRNPLVYMNLPMPQKERLEIIDLLPELLSKNCKLFDFIPLKQSWSYR
jgi:hypothetical protein